MLFGYFLRKRVKLLQDLYLPAALVAGFIGLLLGPQVLGQFSPVYIPISASIGKWAGVLTAVVFSVSFLGTKPKDFGETALSASIHAGIGHQLQVCVGLICAFIFMHFYDIPLGFGLTPVYGFYGGHGTALSAGTLFQECGWEGGLDGRQYHGDGRSGVRCGVRDYYDQHRCRKGKTVYVKEPSQIPEYIKKGYVEPENRKPIGKGVTYNDVIDPFGSGTLLERPDLLS